MVKNVFFIFAIGIFLYGCLSSVNPVPPIEKLFSQQRFEEAIIACELFLSENPSSPYAAEITYLLGKAYLEIDNPYESVRVWEDYLRKFPGGKHRKEVAAAIEKWKQKKGKTYLSQMEEEIKGLSLAYEKVLGKKMPPSQLYVTLGNIYWEEGEKRQALSLYRKAVKLDPSLMNNPAISSRLENSIPEQSPPLEVEDENILSLEKIWKGEWEEESGELKNFRIKRRLGIIVSGKVKNTGMKEAKKVRLLVTLYDFYARILSSKSIWLGEIPAGKSIPFSVVFKGIEKDKVHSVDYLILKNNQEGKK
ncbi:MAG: tetratricopeptide repeat protein [Caldiserica bacterium]|nr:tetratricopeptide repeat protein [Caldisericota bacterium]